MLGVPVGRPRPSLSITPDERAGGRVLLQRHGISEGVRTAGLVLSSGEEARGWPPDHFATLADALVVHGVQPIAFETPEDGAKIDRACARSRALVRIAVPALRDFMGALSACDVLVSGDTGPAHIATALGVPRVTIYGPEPPTAWAPPDDPSVIALRAASATTLGRVASDNPRYSTISSEVTPAMVSDAVQRLLGADGARGTRYL
jgi:ADP-heptose:LPS heptosyltransferase